MKTRFLNKLAICSGPGVPQLELGGACRPVAREGTEGGWDGFQAGRNIFSGGDLCEDVLSQWQLEIFHGALPHPLHPKLRAWVYVETAKIPVNLRNAVFCKTAFQWAHLHSGLPSQERILPLLKVHCLNFNSCYIFWHRSEASSSHDITPLNVDFWHRYKKWSSVLGNVTRTENHKAKCFSVKNKAVMFLVSISNWGEKHW